MDDALYNTYVQPQTGGNLPVFSGSRRHLKGGSFFGTLARFAFPILKNLGRRALGAVSRGATQYLSGNKPLGSAMIDEFGDEAADLAQRGINKIRQRGRGKKRKRLSNF